MASFLNEKDLATLGRSARAAFTVAYAILEKNDSIISKLPDAGALRSEMQRFQLWAINLGLFRQDHNSLDYRLRDNEVIRSFTGELLTSLIEALGEITSIASSSSEASASIIAETPTPDILRAENDEPLSVSNDGGSSNSPIMMGDLKDENESFLTLHFEDVAEAINQMYKLASQIRNPKTRNIRTDVDLFKDVDIEIKSEYIKMRKRAELQGIEQIILQSRKILMGYQIDEADLALTYEDQCLIQRLQKSNHIRRQQFEYWRKTKKRSIRAASEAIETLSGSNHHNDGLIKTLKHDTASWVRPSEFTRSLQSSVPPLPEDFILNASKSTYSGTSRGLTVHGPSGERVNWPKPPVAGNPEGDFECPFCFYICDAKYSKDAAWRTHLKHDLRPYVCTYDECTEPNVLYDSWEEWTHHEQWAHQQRIWRCSKHPQHEYVELGAYEEHVRTYHTASMDQMLSSELLESQKTISQVCDRLCPFCQCDFEQPIDLQRHVAGHLESIALLSLPNLDDVDEVSGAGKANSTSANHNYAESKADDFDCTEPLIFNEDDHHWLPNVFNQILPSTPLESTDETSVSFGEHNPKTMAKLDKAYVSLIEIPFDDGGLIVRLYSRPEDGHYGRPRFVCHAVYSDGSRKDCSIPLVALNVSRSGPFLYFNRVDQPKAELWACLKFFSYEKLVLFFCSFLALRFDETKNPVGKITDFYIHKERELFAGRIIDHYYEHALRLFREEDTGVIRLQASVQSGALKRKPIWTAFINDQILSPTWMSQDSPRAICLADLQQYIFTKEYKPQMTATGAFELYFIDPADEREFFEAIEELREIEKARRRDKVDDS